MFFSSRALGFFTLFLTLSACGFLPFEGRRTIHIHPGGLEGASLERVVRDLEEADYGVSVRDNQSPFTGMGNTLVHDASFNSDYDIDQIDAVLRRHGESISTVIAREGQNHRYTQGNVGLYLDSRATGDSAQLLEAQSPVSLRDVEFSSQDCGATTVLNFDENTAVFATLGAESQVTVPWKQPDESTVRVTAGQNNRYEIHQRTALDERKRITTLVLMPKGYYRNPFGCVYVGRMTESVL